MVRKPGKNQRSKERCHDLGRKVHYRAKYFVLPLYTMHELCNQHISIALDPPNGVNNYCNLCTVKSKKTEQKPTTKNFVEFHNHSPLLTIIKAEGISSFFSFLKHC